MAEPVEQLLLPLRVQSDVVVRGQVGDELADAGAELVGEVGSRRADQGVDVGTGGFAAHRANTNARTVVSSR